MSERVAREWGAWAEMTAEARRALLDRGTDRIFDADLVRGVAEIFDDVRLRGNPAVIDATSRFDKCTLNEAQLMVSAEEIEAAREQVSDELLAAIRESIAAVRAYSEVVATEGNWSTEIRPGVIIGEKSTPIESVGLFVPSGKASYPSVLIQLATPAVVAGVPNIVAVVPPVPGSDGEVDPAVLVVAAELGVTTIVRANGPAGIAAVTFGTDTIPRVRKITGPGSPAVTAAQIEAQRHGVISHPLLGPSESLILADGSVDVPLLAADLLNEAEHGPDSTSVLVTVAEELVEKVQLELARQIRELPEARRTAAEAALGVNGGIVLAESLAEACEVANEFAPEHMQIAVAPEVEAEVFDGIVHAGEVLLGQQTTISMANFVIGCPAALPTSGYAKANGGVTTAAFLKRSSFAKTTHEALRELAPTVLELATHEGFPAHAAAVTARLDRG